MRPNRRRQAPGEPLPGESGRAELGDFAAKVLDVTEAIPAGRGMSYGDVAEYLGEGGPRQGGRGMALWGGGVAWWRGVHPNGSPLGGPQQTALGPHPGGGPPGGPGPHRR